MAGITITPGTFNPPAAGAVNFRTASWPDFPAPRGHDIKQDYQFQPRHVAEETLTYTINYTRRDWMGGALEVGITADPLPALTAFSLSGARYLPDDSYTTTGASGGVYPSTLAPVATTGVLNIGTITVPYQVGTPLPYNNVRVMLDYALTRVGCTDGASYTVNVLGADDPAADSGSLVISGGAWTDPSSDPYDETQELAGNRIIIITLFRDGEIYDRIWLAIRVEATIEFTPTLDPIDPQPEYATGLSIAELVHGAASTTLAATLPPAIPLVGYERESHATLGTLTP
jgi:hypothetical protein